MTNEGTNKLDGTEKEIREVKSMWTSTGVWVFCKSIYHIYTSHLLRPLAKMARGLSLSIRRIIFMNEVKGYYTSGDYWGWVGDHYMRFESESAYLDYISEVEE